MKKSFFFFCVKKMHHLRIPPQTDYVPFEANLLRSISGHPARGDLPNLLLPSRDAIWEFRPYHHMRKWMEKQTPNVHRLSKSIANLPMHEDPVDGFILYRRDGWDVGLPPHSPQSSIYQTPYNASSGGDNSFHLPSFPASEDEEDFLIPTTPHSQEEEMDDWLFPHDKHQPIDEDLEKLIKRRRVAIAKESESESEEERDEPDTSPISHLSPHVEEDQTKLNFDMDALHHQLFESPLLQKQREKEEKRKEKGKEKIQDEEQEATPTTSSSLNLQDLSSIASTTPTTINLEENSTSIPPQEEAPLLDHLIHSIDPLKQYIKEADVFEEVAARLFEQQKDDYLLSHEHPFPNVGPWKPSQITYEKFLKKVDKKMREFLREKYGETPLLLYTENLPHRTSDRWRAMFPNMPVSTAYMASRFFTPFASYKDRLNLFLNLTRKDTTSDSTLSMSDSYSPFHIFFK